jgi:hypothetical protein
VHVVFWQTLPQLPQFAWLDVVSVHDPLQSARPGAQVGPESTTPPPLLEPLPLPESPSSTQTMLGEQVSVPAQYAPLQHVWPTSPQPPASAPEELPPPLPELLAPLLLVDPAPPLLLPELLAVPLLPPLPPPSSPASPSGYTIDCWLLPCAQPWTAATVANAVTTRTYPCFMRAAHGKDRAGPRTRQWPWNAHRACAR